MKRFEHVIEIDESEILNAVIKSDDDFSWGKSSGENSHNDEDMIPNLLEPVSNAEEKF